MMAAMLTDARKTKPSTESLARGPAALSGLGAVLRDGSNPISGGAPTSVVSLRVLQKSGKKDKLEAVRSGAPLLSSLLVCRPLLLL